MLQPGIGTTFWVELPFRVAQDMLLTPESFHQPFINNLSGRALSSLPTPLASPSLDIVSPRQLTSTLQPATPLLGARGRPLSVLVVDDDALTRSLMSR